MFIHCMFVDILFLQQNPLQFSLKVLPHIAKLYIHGQAIMERVTINSTRYHMRYHTRYRTFSLSSAWFQGYLQQVINFVKKMYINIFKKELTVTRWQRVANSPTPGKSQKKYMVTRVVTHSVYGNALHYVQFMFVGFEKLSHPSVISISVKLNLLPHVTILYKHGQAYALP